MLISVNKILLALLLCLTFMAQSMASMAMAYDMISMQSATQQTSAENAAMHSMNNCHEDTLNSTKAETSSTKCCPQECHCLASGCVNAAIFLTTINYSVEVISFNKITSVNHLLMKQAETSLYRPPILS